jgi:hypothetical protein
MRLSISTTTTGCSAATASARECQRGVAGRERRERVNEDRRRDTCDHTHTHTHTHCLHCKMWETHEGESERHTTTTVRAQSTSRIASAASSPMSAHALAVALKRSACAGSLSRSDGEAGAASTGWLALLVALSAEMMAVSSVTVRTEPDVDGATGAGASGVADRIAVRTLIPADSSSPMASATVSSKPALAPMVRTGELRAGQQACAES